MLTDKELLVEAYQRGHAWNPAYANLQNVDLGRVQLMDGSEQDARDLIASRQASDLNFNVLVAAYHQREAEYDGSIGPATRMLAEIPRCPIPDFAPPPTASFHYDDPDLQAAVETQQRAAAMGSGSWPSCDPDRQGVNSFRVRIDTSNAPEKVKGYIEEALKHVVAAYADMGAAVRYIIGSSGTAEITKRFERLSGSVIGWNYFPDGGTCNGITGRFSSSYAPSAITWANLECHETGHGVGLQHTRGHIMNPSIVTVDPLTWRGSPSEATMKRYFGGVPLTPPTTPTGPTNPAPAPGAVAFRGQFTLIVDGQERGKFHIVPAPAV